MPIRCLSGDVTLGFKEEVQTGGIYIHADTYRYRYIYPRYIYIFFIYIYII